MYKSLTVLHGQAFLRVTEYWKYGCDVILKIAQNLNLRLCLIKLERQSTIPFPWIISLPEGYITYLTKPNKDKFSLNQQQNGNKWNKYMNLYISGKLFLASSFFNIAYNV